MDRILVLGGSGLIGTAIINEMNKHKDFDVYATFYNRTIPLNKERCFRLDIEILEDINEILNTVKPKIIISCLRGDFDRQLALHKRIAEYLKKNDGKLYFLSTTNVFDNDFSRPHYENDLPNSHSDYGNYKIECEKNIIEILHDNACIIRIPQIWGKNSPRMKEILKSIENKEKVVIYPKLFLNTNTDIMLAKQIAYIIQNNLKGIFHLGAKDIINNKDFYNELITKLGYNNVKLEEEFDVEGAFAILSKRNSEFPKELLLTNNAVIEYLASELI